MHNLCTEKFWRLCHSGVVFEFQEVPRCAVEVLEYGDCAVGLVSGVFSEFDAFAAHVGVGGLEVGGVQEKADAAAVLVADRGGLGRGGGFGDQEGCFGVLVRGHADPAFVVLWGVFKEVELEGAGEPVDGVVVVVG